MVLLDGYTSQGFWRLVYPADRVPTGPCERAPDGKASSSFRDIEPLLPNWFDEDFRALCTDRVGVLALDQRSRRQTALHYTTVWSGPFPENSFFDLGNGAFVSSPCFTFLQMATELDLCKLIAYGDELCGCYSFDEREPRGIRQRSAPLVTVDQLANYLESTRGCHGHKAAMRAIPHIVDGSASPMETVDEMLLCLPYRLGGYGILKPSMNQRVDLSERLVRLAGRRFCRADICWPDFMLDIEHQGARDHADDDSFDSDRARINALVSMGFEVMELTRGQVSDLRSFEEIALHVAKVVGKRFDKTKLGATDERLELRRKLFAWNGRSGRLLAPDA